MTPLPRIVFPELIPAEDSARALYPGLERWLIAHLRRPAHYRIDAVIVPEPDVPDSLSALLDATRGLVEFDEPRGGAIFRGGTRVGRPHGQRIPVSGAHSDSTIWSSPDVNALFRAWHDSLHILHAEPFDERGETVIARAHVTDARRFGLPDGPLRRALWAETYGQTVHYKRFGTFPEDQRGFVAAAVNLGLDRALDRIARTLEAEQGAR